MQFDLIVFDWDGTLLDSTPAIARCLQQACADLALPIPSEATAKQVIGLGLADAIAYAVPQATAQQLPQFLERYRHHYFMRDHVLTLFPEVREMLGELKQRGHQIAVATGKSRVGLNRALAQTDLQGLFDATRCADESFSKPHPAMLLELSEQFGVECERVLMIGDTTHDLQMAINAGMSSVAVTYGAHALEDLRALRPLNCIDSSQELRAWLKQHG